MNTNQFKKLLDACFIAKRITETMEELPKGFKPRHIHVIDCIYDLSMHSPEVCVSDVSGKMNITTPSITKLINELEEKMVVEKYAREGDKRITLIRLTELGIQYHNYYVLEYHKKWSKNLQDISDDQVEMVVEIIERLLETMPRTEKYNG